MILHNIHIAGEAGQKNIHIKGQSITAVTDAPVKEGSDGIYIDNAIAIPGLINSHDHLDFNLFPQLGDGLYTNYREWGHDIQKKYKQEINNVLKVPASLRAQWGVYKNLLAGITTVVHHGKTIELPIDLITVIQDSYTLHSPGFEKGWRWKLNLAFNRAPVVMHIGEGTDAIAAGEIDDVIRWNVFRRKIVAVHGVAMTPSQARHFSALVWCPASNYFMFNRTADIHELSNATRILFGTDSTLTASWNIWDHLRVARQTQSLTATALLHTVTRNASRQWGLNSGEIASDRMANIVVARMPSPYPDAGFFFDIDPADLLLVMHAGKVRLFDESLRDQVQPVDLHCTQFHPIKLKGQVKWVAGNLPALANAIQNFLPSATFPFEEC